MGRDVPPNSSQHAPFAAESVLGAEAPENADAHPWLVPFELAASTEAAAGRPCASCRLHREAAGDFLGGVIQDR